MDGQKMTSKIKAFMRYGRERMCSLLFPQRCPVCDELLEPEEVKKGIHSVCESKLFPILGAVCMHCGRPIGDKNHGNQKNEYGETILIHMFIAVSNLVSLFTNIGIIIKNRVFRLVKYSAKRSLRDGRVI
jgi:hypothetical protein